MRKVILQKQKVFFAKLQKSIEGLVVKMHIDVLTVAGTDVARAQPLPALVAFAVIVWIVNHARYSNVRGLVRVDVASFAGQARLQNQLPDVQYLYLPNFY